MPRPFKGTINLDVRDSVPGVVAGHRADLVLRDDLVGYDSGDAVSSLYKPKFEFSGGAIHKVVFDVADDAYVDAEHHLAAAFARD
jgi:hypothetical protein